LALKKPRTQITLHLDGKIVTDNRALADPVEPTADGYGPYGGEGGNPRNTSWSLELDREIRSNPWLRIANEQRNTQDSLFPDGQL
jgi:hypothetical protein